jgi:hypothetical protein
MLTAAERTRRNTALTIAESALRAAGGVQGIAPRKVAAAFVNGKECPEEERSGAAREAPSTRGERVGDEPIPVGTDPRVKPGDVAPHVSSHDLVATLVDVAPIDTWITDGTGIARWRPVQDRLDVVPLPGGQSLIVLPNGFRIKLSRECSAHLSRLLDPERR